MLIVNYHPLIIRRVVRESPEWLVGLFFKRLSERAINDFSPVSEPASNWAPLVASLLVFIVVALINHDHDRVYDGAAEAPHYHQHCGHHQFLATRELASSLASVGSRLELAPANIA